MTTIFFDGLESGGTTNFTSSSINDGNSISVIGSLMISGNYCLQCATSSISTNAYLSKTFSPTNTVYVGFNCRFAGTPPANDNYQFLALGDTSNSIILTSFFSNWTGVGGQLYGFWVNPASTSGYKLTTIEPNRWYYVGYKFVRGEAGAGQVIMYVDGSSVASAVCDTSYGNSYSVIHIGNYASDIAGGCTMWFDNIEISDAYIKPPVKRGIISITFDDGLESQYTNARTILSEKGYKASYYIITNHVGDSGYMNVGQLGTLFAEENDIASHGISHANFTGLSEASIRSECTLSQNYLRGTVNSLCAYNFAYPYGENNATTDTIVADYFTTYRDAYNVDYLNDKTITSGSLSGVQGEYGNTLVLPNLKNIVAQAYGKDSWAVIFFHNVSGTVSSTTTTMISVPDFQSFIDYLANETNVDVKSIRQVTNPFSTYSVSMSFILNNLLKANVTDALVPKYNDKANISKVFRGLHKVKAKVTKAFTSKFNIKTKITKNITSKVSKIYAKVTKTLRGKYTIKAKLTKVFRGLSSVRINLSKAFISKYLIKAKLTKSPTFKYGIIQKVTKPFTSKVALMYHQVNRYLTNDDGLMLHWKLDENSGSIVTDSSPSGINGIVNPSTIWVEGKYGYGVHLSTPNPDNSGILSSTLDGARLQVLNENCGKISMALWVRPTTLEPAKASNQWYILNMLYYPLGGWWLYETNDGKANFVGFKGNNQSSKKTSTNSLVLNDWTHIAVVTDSNDINMYINGSLDGSATTLSSHLIDAPYNRALQVGGWSNYDFVGDVDDIRLYDRPLTADEVASIYNNSLEQYGGYNLKNNITKQFTHVYDIIVNVTKSISLKYNIKANISKVLTSLYNIIGKIQVEKVFGGSYTLKQNISRALSGLHLSKVNVTKQYGILSDGLVAYYKMDEQGNTIVNDYHGNINGVMQNGTTFTTPASFVDGKYNNGVTLNSSQQQYIGLGTTDVLSFPSTMTAMAWVKFPDSVGTYTLFSKCSTLNQSTATNFWLDIRGTLTQIYFGGYYNTSLSAYTNVNYTFNTNEWYHVVGVDTGSSLQIFVNNSLIAQATANHPRNTNSTWETQIGRRGGMGQYFNGIIDDVRFYNRGLSAQEISAIYNSDIKQYDVKANVSNTLSFLDNIKANVTKNLRQFYITKQNITSSVKGLYTELANVTKNLYISGSSADIFTANMENGDFSEFNTINNQNGTVEISAISHHGNYGGYAYSNDNTIAYVYAVKTLDTNYSSLYSSAYVNVLSHGMKQDNDRMFFITNGSTTNSYLAWFGWKSNGTVPAWALLGRNGNNYTSYSYNTIIPCNTNTWYHIELYWKNSSISGELMGYVNGTLACSLTGTWDTSYYGNAKSSRFGMVEKNGTFPFFGATVAFDCCKVSNTYIGPETRGYFIKQNISNAMTGLNNLKSKIVNILSLSDGNYGSNTLSLNFDNGTYSPFTKLVTGNGTVYVSNEAVYSGNNGLVCKTADSVTYEYACLYGNHEDMSEHYARTYVRAIDFADASWSFQIINGRNTSSGMNLLYAHMKHSTTGTNLWRIVARNGASSYPASDSTMTWEANRWYCLETYWKKDSINGEAKLFVDNTLACSLSGIDTSTYGDVQRTYFGIYTGNYQGYAHVNIDDCIVSNSYIGPNGKGYLIKQNISNALKSLYNVKTNLTKSITSISKLYHNVTKFLTSNEVASSIIVDDDQDTFWGILQGGTGSIRLIDKVDSSIDVISGENALNVTLDKNGTLSYFVLSHNFGTIDWSNYNRISCWANAHGNTGAIEFYVYAPNSSNRYYWGKTISPDWSRIELPFNEAITIGSPSLSSVTTMRIQAIAYNNQFMYNSTIDNLSLSFDRFILDTGKRSYLIKQNISKSLTGIQKLLANITKYFYIENRKKGDIFEDDFGNGNLDLWTYKSTNAIISTTEFHHNNYSCYLNDYAYIYKIISSINEVYARQYIKMSSLPTTSAGKRLLLLRDIAGTPSIIQVYYADNSPLRITAYNEITGSNIGTYNINLGTSDWHCFEVHYKTDTNGSDGIFELYIDGNLVISSYNQNFNSSQVGRYYIICDSGIGMFTDCVKFSTSYIGTESNGYLIKANITKTLTAIHKLYAKITKAIRGRYLLKANVIKSIRSLYLIKQNITQALTSLTTVRNNLVKTLVTSYTVKILLREIIEVATRYLPKSVTTRILPKSLANKVLPKSTTENKLKVSSTTRNISEEEE